MKLVCDASMSGRFTSAASSCSTTSASCVASTSPSTAIFTASAESCKEWIMQGSSGQACGVVREALRCLRQEQMQQKPSKTPDLTFCLPSTLTSSPPTSRGLLQPGMARLSHGVPLLGLRLFGEHQRPPGCSRHWVGASPNYKRSPEFSAQTVSSFRSLGIAPASGAYGPSDAHI